MRRPCGPSQKTTLATALAVDSIEPGAEQEDQADQDDGDDADGGADVALRQAPTSIRPPSAIRTGTPQPLSRLPRRSPAPPTLPPPPPPESDLVTAAPAPAIWPSGEGTGAAGAGGAAAEQPSRQRQPGERGCDSASHLIPLFRPLSHRLGSPR